jgi:hypothetical protein
MAVDQMKAGRVIAARIDETDNPRHKAMLECVREHIRAEGAEEFDALMATMCPDPAFHFWVDGSGNGAGPKGTAAVSAHYRKLYEEQRHVFEIDIERIVVDDRTVVTEGWFRQVCPGRVLRERGADIDDPDASYLVTMRLILLWPFDPQGRLIGEDSYSSGSMFDPRNIRKLRPDEVTATAR